MYRGQNTRKSHLQQQLSSLVCQCLHRSGGLARWQLHVLRYLCVAGCAPK